MRSHSKALFAVAALFAVLLVPSTAFAGKPVNDFFGTVGTGNGQFGGFPGGLAVNQSSGDLYAFDQTNSRVQRFDADGNYLSQFGEAGSGAGQFSVPNLPNLFPVAQIAIDQADGSVYVADPGNNRVQKFEADGTFVVVIDTATGSSVSETFSEAKGVAVGTDGALYVADTGNNRIVKFDSSGTYLSDLSIPAGEGEGELNSPAGIAVDSTGALYVYDSDVGFGGRVQKFSAAGSFEYALSPGEPLWGVTTDTTNDHVFVSGRTDIYEFEATGALQDTHHVDPSDVGLSLVGVAVNDDDGPIYAGNLNGTSQGGAWILIFDEPGIPVPSATIDPVTIFDSDSASFSGEVNPNGNIDADWRFEVSPANGSVTPGGTVSEGNSPGAVNGEATDLEPNTEYQVSLVASKPFVEAKAIDSTTFTTDASPPTVEALDPGPVTTTTAWLGGYVNPHNAATTFSIEYSISPDFVGAIAVPASGAFAGSGGGMVLANQLVGGLQPDTPYYYRVVASNVAGTAIGETRSTRTASTAASPQGLPGGRVWEKVSPAEKGGGNISGGNYSAVTLAGEVSRAAAEGEAVAFGSGGKFGGEGGAAQSQYLASRGASGWSTVGINLPQSPIPDLTENFNYFQWLSRDLSRGVGVTHSAINPGDPEYVYNLYLRNHTTGQIDTISDGDMSPPPRPLYRLRGVSPNERHFLFSSPSAGPAGNSGVLKDRRVDGDLEIVSILPDGSVTRGALGSGNAEEHAVGFNAISESGSRIYFADVGNGIFNEMTRSPVYLRENGSSTTLVSASERADDEPTVPQPAEFVAASKDGSVAFFRSQTRLTEESNPGIGRPCLKANFTCSSLYRWDASAPTGQRLTDLTVGDPLGAHVLGVLGVSDDGASIYFAAVGRLDGNGSRSQVNLYLWNEDQGTTFIGRLEGGIEEGPGGGVNNIEGRRDRGLWTKEVGSANAVDDKHPNDRDNPEGYRSVRVTPDGRYIAFASHVPQTAYDTNNNAAIYIYDSQTERIVCVSCGTVEEKSQGDSWFVSCSAEQGSETVCSTTEYLPRNLRTDGQQLIFDSQDALVPQDTNGVTDVYQWRAGKLDLLSSGTSAVPSRFVDASESGDDVFFITGQRLTRSDQDDLRDLYDARVGGSPEPEVKPPCIADECQGTPKAPRSFGTPSSASFDGPGNASHGKKRRCRTGKIRRRGRCVNRKARHAKKPAGKDKRRRANDKRGARR